MNCYSLSNLLEVSSSSSVQSQAAFPYRCITNRDIVYQHCYVDTTTVVLRDNKDKDVLPSGELDDVSWLN